MIVVKFGGSSLAGPQRMLAAAHIVAHHTHREAVICVVSAMAGITDQLYLIASLAVGGVTEWREPYADLRERHEQTLAALVTSGDNEHSLLAPLWRALEADAAALSTLGEGYEREEAVAVFSTWGERLSVRLFAAALANLGVDASPFEDAPVIVDDDGRPAAREGMPSVTATDLWLRDPMLNLLQWGKTPVLPGYLALTQDGVYTTLGRNGSDHSAAVIGAALDASAIYIYSDVAGIHQADPGLIPRARLLTALTYGEATAIASRGARVLHPAAIPPLAQRGIPLHLRSALDPDAPGTDIGHSCTTSIPTQTMEATPLPVLFASLALAGTQGKVGRPDAF
jgi:aspartate kinase